MSKKNFFTKYFRGDKGSMDRKKSDVYAPYDLETFEKTAKGKSDMTVPQKSLNPFEEAKKSSKPPVENAEPVKTNQEISAFELEEYLRRTDTIPASPKEDTKVIKVYKPFIPREKKNIIFFVVENSETVYEYKDQVAGVINKIISANKEDLFCFLTVGNGQKTSDVIDFATVNSTDVIRECINKPENPNAEVRISEALIYIYDYLKNIVPGAQTIEIKGKKYDLLKVKVIFIGSGKGSLEDTKVASHINLLKFKSVVSTIKYICINDKDAINVAAMGFPVIGHIVSNFYK